MLLFLSANIWGQTNEEIANVYIKKAQANYANLEVQDAHKNFGKAMKLLDTIKKASIARLGTLIQYELSNFKEAKAYAKQYFTLSKKKKSEEYNQLLELYVEIEDELEKIEIEKAKKEKARIAKEKETKRLDSLKNIWKKRADALTLKYSTVNDFNKNGIATFKQGDYYGLTNDVGTVLLKADTYKAVKAFDGIVLFLNKATNPTQIYAYNTQAKSGKVLPSVSSFNPLSTHYGAVMMPRGNGIVVTYPNNALKAFIYNINTNKFLTVDDQKTLFKDLKKTDKIEKYNKDGQVRLDRKWYNFGGHIGGGIFPLYNTDYSVYGFLCSIDGTVLKATDYNAVGGFYKEKLLVENEGTSFWVNQNGAKVKAPENDNGTYDGASKVIAIENGGFRIHREIDGVLYIILGDEKLEMLEDFLRKHP
ncbi:MAG: hypothetical protein HWD85_12840 [Flavobacteriaceae bacterium]|nr:hypothetical protein [Flavobacteriaceae bacterium]